jgi:hypothetical protein
MIIEVECEADFCEELQRDRLTIQGDAVRMQRTEWLSAQGAGLSLVCSYLTPTLLVEWCYTLRPGHEGILSKREAHANLDAVQRRVADFAQQLYLDVRPGVMRVPRPLNASGQDGPDNPV